jgi:alpha-mannosidase
MMADSFVVQKHWRATFERIEKFISPLYFTDVNLFGRLYPDKCKVTAISTISSQRKISFEQAVSKLEENGSTVTTGYTFGPTWSTHWFKCQIEIPSEWRNKHVRFRWNSGCEAMIWKDGNPIQGLTGGDSQKRYDFILTESSKGGEQFLLYVEAAANGMFGAGNGGMINPPNPDLTFVLSLAEVAVFNVDAYHLLMDLTVLAGMAKQLPKSDHRAYDALYKANEIINQCGDFTPNTLQRLSFCTCEKRGRQSDHLMYLFHICRLHESCSEFFSKRNGEAQFSVYAFGHCHIDSAWLWPYSETIRKCARSWSSQLLLMDKYSDFKFVCSQMQQFAWIKEFYPSLFQAIKCKIKSGQFIPVGGTWIEMDGNIPSGESFIRQFLCGHHFLTEELGASTSVFWLPDTFGYSAQLPQIATKCGMKYFLTQKLSWSLTNKFPHNTFLWEGLDGSKILTHFPSADTYESDGSVADVLKTVHEHKDKGRSNSAILLYGFGDGGGGPQYVHVQYIN